MAPIESYVQAGSDNNIKKLFDRKFKIKPKKSVDFKKIDNQHLIINKSKPLNDSLNFIDVEAKKDYSVS